MDYVILVALGVVAVLVGAALGVALWAATRQKTAPVDMTPVTMMQSEIQGLRQELGRMTGQVSSLMSESNKLIGDRLQHTSSVVAEVSGKLGELSGATRQMLDVGKDIAGLQDILRAPKIRGVMGEILLGDLLAQILPQDFYVLQNRFRSGETVDAVIKLGPSTVPVDSKFPLENFRRVLAGESEAEKNAMRREFGRDLRKHIDAISAKYILPDEGTYDFALMYIPAENVYYEMIVSPEALCGDKTISEYALSKRVIPVSPNCFYAYLQAIVLGFKGLRIEKSARDVMDNLARLRQDLGRFQDDFQLVGKHLGNARTKYEDAEKRFIRFADKLESASAGHVELPRGGAPETGSLLEGPAESGDLAHANTDTESDTDT